MSRAHNLVEVRMARATLEDLPDYDLPPHFAFRYYQPGDVETWVRVQRQSEPYHDISTALFQREFGDDVMARARRMCFLLDGDGNAIGAATAWFNDAYRGQSYGRIHWVAIVPAWQGRGLSKPLIAEICLRMRRLGHCRAYLTTESVRIPAINLYSRFGFTPEIDTAEDLQVWRDIQRQGARITLSNPHYS